jgi:hypothetical protein
VGLLLDIADDLELADDRWRRGVEFATYGCDGLSRGSLAFCAESEFDPDSGAVSDTLAYFGAFGIYADQTCSTLDVDMEYLQGRLDARWMTYVSEQVAAELEVGGSAPAVVPDGGGGFDPSPTLQNSAAVGTATAGTLAEAFAAVEYGLAASLHGGAGLIHVAPFLLSAIGGDLVTRGPDGQWQTYSGHTIVADAGYTGAAPDAGSSSPYTRWIYGSGPVAYQLGAPRTPGVNVEGFNSSHNEFTARTVAEALVIFDPCAVTAAEFELVAGS